MSAVQGMPNRSISSAVSMVVLAAAGSTRLIVPNRVLVA